MGVNADFLKEFYGLNNRAPAGPPAECPFGFGGGKAERIALAKKYLDTKLHEVREAVEKGTIKLLPLGVEQVEGTKNLVKRGQIPLHAYIAIMLNHASAPFLNLFNDFGNYLKQNIGATINPLAKLFDTRTPITEIIQAGVHGASHLWEVILKSIIIKRGSQLTAAEFRDAIDKSRELLLDLTQIPLVIFVELSSYLFNRGTKPYAFFKPDEMYKERMGKNIKEKAIKYDLDSRKTSLDTTMLSRDPGFIGTKARIAKHKAIDLEVQGCPGLKIIPLYIQYMQQIFEQYLFPEFDQLIRYAKP